MVITEEEVVKTNHICLVCLIGIVCLAGCTSPLKSADRSTRLEAVEKVSSQDDLFFIAMNVGLDVGSRHGSFYDSILYAESYADDVREAAARRLTDPVFLLRCATWQDGDMFCNFADESGAYLYNGERYYTQGIRLRAMVRPGDNVRRVAAERLCKPAVFASLPGAFESFQHERMGSRRPSLRAALFPGEERYHVGGAENAFVDCYAKVKKDNPLNSVLAKAAGAQSSQSALSAFVVSSRNDGLVIWPEAVCSAISAMDGSDSRALANAFDALFPKESKGERGIPALWGWSLLSKMRTPSEERQLTMAMIGYGEEPATENRLEIDHLAEATLADGVWARCYRERLFNGYPPSKMLANVKSAECMAQLLIDIRKIDSNDVDLAFGRIKDVAMLERIKRDCHLKVVAEKAESLHFALTYRQRLEAIAKMNSVIGKAMAANGFRKQMEGLNIGDDERERITLLVRQWIDAGLAQIVASADDGHGAQFNVAGFRVGMKNSEAKLLFECRYPDEEIAWVANKNDLVERIDFGTTFLAKIYNFDASTWKDWAGAFSQKNGFCFVSEVLRDERKPIGGRGTVVKVSQQIWRCQDRQRDLTITYFGEKNVQEIEPKTTGLLESAFKVVRGVMGGDIVKEVVLEGARHWANKGWDAGIGGVAGTLRVERGTVGPGGTRKVGKPTGKSNLDRTADSVKDTFEAVKGLFN